MMVLGISAHRAAVFPLSGPDAVDAAERMARRQAAYRLTAADGLPHHIREAAAPLSRRSTTGVTATPTPPSRT
ncbi:hypothetical protein [Streptomyces wuyuanensis]|uniref:hypothetical protein n=1 Tax=Streptomyces wuyuanensis TaxID=1196353 RepID=UPI00371A7D88